MRCAAVRPHRSLLQLGADSELSVKNGAELLDRLIKDIVSESAATYVSVLEQPPPYQEDDKDVPDGSVELPTAFSLKRFIPLLKDRIYALNPFTRTFLVGWIILLDSIPDLELVTYLPEFLGGLLRFLSDPNRDVHVATQGCLDKFLNEIKRIARIKKGIAESKKSKGDGKRKRVDSVDSGSVRPQLEDGDEIDSETAADDDDLESEEDWIPGQDVQINFKAILEILTATLDSPLGKLYVPGCIGALLTMIRRRGWAAGVASLDSRVSRHMSRRSAPLHPQDTSSPAARHGQRCGIDPPGRREGQHFPNGLRRLPF